MTVGEEGVSEEMVTIAVRVDGQTACYRFTDVTCRIGC